MLDGTFSSQGLKAGVYSLKAIMSAPPAADETTEREFLLTPNPLDWSP